MNKPDPLKPGAITISDQVPERARTKAPRGANGGGYNTLKTANDERSKNDSGGSGVVLLEVPQRKERRSSLEICGLATPEQTKQLQAEMAAERAKYSTGRRMSVPTLPSHTNRGKSKTNGVHTKKLETKDDMLSSLDLEPTSHVYEPPERNARTDLAHLKRDLRLLRPKSITQLRLNGRTSTHEPGYRDGRGGEGEEDEERSLGEQFESLRLCRYLRQPGHELQELDAKQIFKED